MRVTGDHRWSIALIVLTAVVVRACYFHQYVNSPLAGFHQADQRLYSDWAAMIAEGDWLGGEVFRQGPLYAYLLGLLFSMAGPSETLLLALQLAIGVATCLLIYGSARRLFDEVTGIAAGLIAAVYGPFVFYECLLLKTFLSPFLTALVLWSALRYGERRAAKWLVLCGVGVGLACLVRENHVLLLIPLLWWCRRTFQEPDRSRTGWLRHALLLLTACGATVLPCTLRNAWVGGEFVAVTSGGGEVFYLGHGPQAATGFYNAPSFIRADPRFEHEDFRREASRRVGKPLSPAESSRYWFHESLRLAASNPLRTANLSLQKTLILLNDFEAPDSEDYQISQRRLWLLRLLPGFGLLCGLGLVGMVHSVRREASLWLPLGLLLCHALTVVLLFNYARFRMGMMPIWIIFAAHAVVWLVRAFRDGRGKVGWPAVIAIAVATLIAYLPPLGYSQTDYEQESRAILELLEERGDRLQELSQLRTRAAKEPHSSGAQLAVARALVGVGDFNQAERSYQRVVELEPKLHSAREEWAKLKLIRGQISRGSQLFFESQGLLDESVAGDYKLGLVLQEVDRLELAAEQFQAVIRQQENHADAHYHLGQVLGRLQRVDEAVAHFGRFALLRSEDAEAQFKAALELESLGRAAGAIACYQRSVRLDADQGQAHYNLAVLLAQASRVEEAKAHYEQVIRIDPENADAHNNLGAQLVKLGRLPEALVQFQAALRVDHNHGQARQNFQVVAAELRRTRN